jgi:hypothetical protein
MVRELDRQDYHRGTEFAEHVLCRSVVSRSIVVFCLSDPVPVIYIRDWV